MKNKKILIPLIILIVFAVGGYAAKSYVFPPKKVKIKVSGSIYVLPKQFTLNMAGGQYATLTVGLLLPPTQTEGVTDPNNPPPTGFGSLPEEAVIRAIITNDVTDQPASALITTRGRAGLESRILKDIKLHSDTQVSAIYFTDIAVQ